MGFAEKLYFKCELELIAWHILFLDSASGQRTTKAAKIWGQIDS